MVSFSCESCGDVLTKKKLDAHRNRCSGCTFTCLDCMVHFRGLEYRLHTSCISEAEKYQGALYRPDKEKKGKASRLNSNQKSHNGDHSVQIGPRKAYVEDAPDHDSPRIGGPTTTITTTAISTAAAPISSPPPHAPSPPPATGGEGRPVNVFDFLVDDYTPNTSSVALDVSRSAGPQDAEPMMMVQHARSVFDPSPPSPTPLPSHLQNPSEVTLGESSYQTNGFHYGQGPVPVTSASTSFHTPGPRLSRHENGVRTQKKDSNKRKRVHIEDLDLSAAGSRSIVEREMDDAPMLDAPMPRQLHTGLTGGLDRLLSGRRRGSGDYSSSPVWSRENAAESPCIPQPHVRTKTVTANALVRTKKHREGSDEREERRRERDRDRDRDRELERDRSRGDEKGEREERRASKKHRKHRRRSSSHSREEREGSQHRRSGSTAAAVMAVTTTTKRNGHVVKAIEDRRDRNEREGGQLVVFRSRAELFMSFVNKGPESERGVSINKALKRYHRERSGSDGRGGLGRGEEEKELWKSMRLRRNEMGEIIVLF